jgi:hypothetical protein
MYFINIFTIQKLRNRRIKRKPFLVYFFNLKYKKRPPRLKVPLTKPPTTPPTMLAITTSWIDI